MEALQEDVRRFLAREPVRAHPPGVGYAARKWAARNPLASLLILALAAVVMAGVATVGIHSRRVQTESERTSTLLHFLLDDLLGEVSPVRGGPQLTVGTVLERAAHHVESLEGRPELEAAVRHALGSVQLRQGTPGRGGGRARQGAGIMDEVGHTAAGALPA